MAPGGLTEEGGPDMRLAKRIAVGLGSLFALMVAGSAHFKF
jgi:hypothetical protein